MNEQERQGAAGGDPASYARCAGITKAGERCSLDATSGSYCWSHAPENAQARKARARRGGRAGGNGRSGGRELDRLRGELDELFAGIREGRIEPKVGAVAAQIQNVRLRLVESERKRRIEEQEMISMEQARALLGIYAEALKRHVKDGKILEAISRDIRAARDPSEG